MRIFLCFLAVVAAIQVHADELQIPSPLYRLDSKLLCAVSTTGENRLFLRRKGELVETNKKQATAGSKKRQRKTQKQIRKVAAKRNGAGKKKLKNLKARLKKLRSTNKKEKNARREIQNCLNGLLLPSIRQPLTSGTLMYANGSRTFQFINGDMLFHNFGDPKNQSVELRVNGLTTGNGVQTLSGVLNLSFFLDDENFGMQGEKFGTEDFESALFEENFPSSPGSTITGAITVEFQIPDIIITLDGLFEGQAITGELKAEISSFNPSIDSIGDINGDGDVDFEDYLAFKQRCYENDNGDIEDNFPCLLGNGFTLSSPEAGLPIFTDGFESGNVSAWSSSS